MHVADEYTDAASRPNEDEQGRLLRLFLARRQAKDMAADLANRVAERQAKDANRITLEKGCFSITFDPLAKEGHRDDQDQGGERRDATDGSRAGRRFAATHREFAEVSIMGNNDSVLRKRSTDQVDIGRAEQAILANVPNVEPDLTKKRHYLRYPRSHP